MAINRGHDLVTENDLYAARKEYSEFALRTVLVEDDPRKGKLESVLYEFAGVSQFLRRSDVEGVIQRAGVGGEDIDFYTNLLCDLNFLGISSAGGYVLARDEVERRVLREVAPRVARQRLGPDAEETYWVNSAFHDVLQIQ